MRLTAALAVLLLATPAFAYEVGEDCSVVDGPMRAEAPEDLGGGKLMQRAAVSAGTPDAVHALALTDCAAGAVVMAIGVEADTDPLAPPFSFGPDRDTQALADALNAAGMPTVLHDSYAKVIAEDAHRDGPFCACAIFYPDSLGASDAPAKKGGN